eukprot:774077-Pyramimonas_sp.AAC.1
MFLFGTFRLDIQGAKGETRLRKEAHFERDEEDDEAEGRNGNDNKSNVTTIREMLTIRAPRVGQALDKPTLFAFKESIRGALFNVERPRRDDRAKTNERGKTTRKKNGTTKE